MKLVLGIGAGLVGIMAVVTYHNYRVHQDELAKVSNNPGTASAPALADVSTPPRVSSFTAPATTRSVMDTIRHQADIQLAMKTGWDMVNQRDAKSAETAAEIFREAIRDLDPANAQFYNGLGRANLVAGKPADAIDAFQKGLAINPTIADMQSGIGWGYWQLHQPYAAKQAWEAALKIDPKSPDAWSALAWIYLALGENTKARDGFAVLLASADVAKDAKLHDDAVQGLSMSRSAVQTDIKNVQKFFPLPDLKYLTTPPLPVTTTASAATSRP